MIVMNVITISISFITDSYVIITDHDHHTIKVLYVKLNISRQKKKTFLVYTKNLIIDVVNFMSAFYVLQL